METNKEIKVYVTKSGQTYHTSKDCPTLKHREFTEISMNEIENRKPCKRCCK